VEATPVLVQDTHRQTIDSLIESFKAAAQKRGIDTTEVDLTISQVRRMLTPQGHLSLSQREDLAHQLLTHAIHPMTVKHGNHNTALVASLESKLYEMKPSIVAKVVADIALNGSPLCDEDAVAIELEPRNLKPEACAGSDGERSFASQLFQVSMVNAHLQPLRKDPNGRKLKNAKLHFVQTHDRRHSNDTGERLIIAHDDGTKETLLHEGSFEPISDAGITMTSMRNAYSSLTGRTDFDSLGNIEQRQNPSRFITLGETTVLSNSATVSGVRFGNGWIVAGGNCANGMCNPGGKQRKKVSPSTLATIPH
jgi:hypothetical protein